jgi:sporulation protein YlmC with PRC-barrel domain
VKPTDRLHLVADVRDLQIVDSEGACCGIVDDIELEGEAGGTLAVKALLVGPGAWRGRLSRPLLWLLQRLAGKHVVRVPWSQVKQISSTVTLASTARQLGLARSEERARRMLPKLGSSDAPL